MKKFILCLVAVVFCTLGVMAQTKNGGISEDMLGRIRKGYTGTPEQKAVKNALASNSIATLAINGENLSMIDTHFSHRVPTKGITNQKSSGRCWLFTGLNVLRAKVIAKYDLPGLEFSQNYNSFYDLLEKSNLFLQAIIDTRDLPMEDRKVDWLLKNPIGDGGQFTGVSNLLMKYGVVPREVMPETFQSENTSQMAMILKWKLREYALELRTLKANKAMERKEAMLTEIYRILTECLGVPPTEFEWTRYDKSGKAVSTKKYTPKSFYEEYIGDDLENNYIMVMNDPSREYGKVYEIEYDRHVYDGENWLYLNLPIERVKELAIASIKDNTAMYFSCDVGKFIDRKKGTLDINNMDYASLFRTEFPMDKKQRIQTFSSGSSHAMTLIAVDLDEAGQPKKWMVENSWGVSSGYQGNLIMTDEWFNEYMFRVVIEKKYVPADIMKMLEQKPIMLPSWDPMFAPEE
ncbi:MAG: C1 family peptidase [Bacteroidaceae bacterium]|nr:C1 family peptidase [Bacteroidaceae bacterium]MBR5613370.1 C1 family peptidase [Bacteroidaceae bacterium]